MTRSLTLLMLSAGLSFGCDKNLGTLDGHELGRPKSVVFARDESEHIMVVMSDIEDLCDTLAGTDPPRVDDYWVLSAWTNVSVTDPGEYAVEAFAAIASHKDLEEYDTEAGGIKFKRIRDDLIKAKVDITFPGNDRLKAHVRAKHCDADLFVGMH